MQEGQISAEEIQQPIQSVPKLPPKKKDSRLVDSQWNKTSHYICSDSVYKNNNAFYQSQFHPNSELGLISIIISMIKSNPTRLKQLRESLKLFTPIKKNIYLDRKRKTPKNDELQSCLCRPRYENDNSPFLSNVSYNCQERCLNRMISTECDDETCRCYQLCQNRKFQKHEYKCVYPFPAGGKGWGLCAGQKILRGQFIMQYIGQIFSISSQVGKVRIKQYGQSTCTYLMKTNKNQVIDPTYKGNLARFINHSCDPNCITQKWNVLGQICIGIFAIRDLEEDDQLTFDYQFDVYSTPLTKCLCGSKKCKGYLGLRPTDITMQQWNERLEDMTCEICLKNYDDDDIKLIICDECNKGFHIYCLDPPLQEIPQEAFYCKKCGEVKEIIKEMDDKLQNMINIKIRKEQLIAQHQENDQSSSADDNLPVNEDYEKIYRFIKKQEIIAVKQLQAVVKKQQSIRKSETTPQKRKIETPPATLPPNRKKDQFQELYRKAIDKFQNYLQKNPKILQNINNFSQKKDKGSAKPQRKTLQLNKIQMQLILRNNFILFENIGAQIYFQNSSRNSTDFFLQSTEVNIIGNQEQIKLFQEIVEITTQIINQIQIQMGITEAYVPIPAVFLKRLIGPGQFTINHIEKTAHVAIYYHQRFLNEQCYPLQIQAKMLIKGGKQNILKAYEEIKKKIDSFEIQRLYLNPYEIKTVVNNMPILRRKGGMAEFRISKQPPFKQVNHPFYYIQQKNKEIVIIGTKPEIQKTRRQILSFFEEPNRKEQFNFNISLFLAQPNHKSQLLSVKNSLERQIPSIRMMIFDPTPPRKNMTLSFLGTRENRHKAREYLFRKLEQQSRQGKMPINLQHFQDQMNYQMAKYYFKYMQNCLLTRDTAFMKSWDILNPYFGIEQDNYMWKSIKKQLSTDYQTLLYACFVLKDKILKKIQNQFKNNRTMNEEIYEIVKHNISRILNIYNVNNAPALKMYSSYIDHEEARKLFKDSFPHITFSKPEQKKLVDIENQKQKERQMSFFEKKVFRKHKALLTILQEERRRSREKEIDYRKWR